MNSIFKKNKEEFKLNEIVKKLLSIAKQYGIEELHVPLWNKEFPLIPSLYCSDLKSCSRLLTDLKQHMDIELCEGYIYFNDEIEGIPEFDESRYIKVHMLSIRNISKIKYFGVEKEITYGLEDLFKSFSNKIERSIMKNINHNTFSINNCIVESKHAHNIKNSYLAFLIAINKIIKSHGYFLDLNTYKITHKTDNKFILPVYKRKIVFITELSPRKKLNVIK